MASFSLISFRAICEDCEVEEHAERAKRLFEEAKQLRIKIADLEQRAEDLESAWELEQNKAVDSACESLKDDSYLAHDYAIETGCLDR